jgi:hypothetical protein
VRRFADDIGTFLKEPVGNVSRAFYDWTNNAWYEQVEDVYKVFQSGAAGIGLAGKAKGMFSVGVLDDFASLGPNTQRVLSAYQAPTTMRRLCSIVTWLPAASRSRTA